MTDSAKQQERKELIALFKQLSSKEKALALKYMVNAYVDTLIQARERRDLFLELAASMGDCEHNRQVMKSYNDILKRHQLVNLV